MDYLEVRLTTEHIRQGYFAWPMASDFFATAGDGPITLKFDGTEEAVVVTGALATHAALKPALRRFMALHRPWIGDAVYIAQLAERRFFVFAMKSYHRRRRASGRSVTSGMRSTLGAIAA